MLRRSIVLLVILGLMPVALVAVGDHDFRDVPNSHTHHVGVSWAVDNGITVGCGDGTMFCPDDPVTRGQIAVFVSRAFTLPAATRDHFSDDNGAFYERAANRLAEAGWTAGCGDGTEYCGDREITRGEMSVMLSRALGLPSTSVNYFWDDNSKFYEGAVNRLADQGLTSGCDEGQFCGDDRITRGQMVTFLRRAENPSGSPSVDPMPNPPAPDPDPEPVYRNCTEVWDDIGGPIYRGDPGYGTHLDRDGDGVGCETDPR